MGQDASWGTAVWSAIDHGFRYLFFDNFYGWIVIGGLVGLVGFRIVAERRELD